MVVAREKIEWQEPLEQEIRLKNPRSGRRRDRLAKKKSILLLLFFVSLAASIAAATIQLTVVQGAEVQSLEKEVAELKVRNNLLHMEADKLRAVSRIESEALAMGMEKPAGTVYVASSLPSLSDQKAAPPIEAATPAPEAKTTMDTIKEFAQKFTSFFASTQR